MLTPIDETEIIKRFKPPGEPPSGSGKTKPGGISVFPNAPMDMPPETFTKALNKREENRKALIQWMRQHFREGIEFGRIHLDERCRYARVGSPGLCREISHYSQPMLYKAGAERIIGVLGLSAHFPNLHQYELSAVHHQEIKEIVLKCELKASNGTVVAEGSGARNIRQDNWNLNTSIKMAAKSALVDAVIRIGALSGIFIATQRKTLTRLGVCRDGFRHMGDCHERLQGRSDCNATPTGPVTSRQRDFILKLAGHRGLTTEGLEKECMRLFNKDLEDLNKVEASRLIQHLNGYLQP